MDIRSPVLWCGPADLAATQTGDLGDLRPRVPNNTADHSRQDLDVLRADLPAIGPAAPLIGWQHEWWQREEHGGHSC